MVAPVMFKRWFKIGRQRADHTDTVRAFVAALNARDYRSASRFLTDDFVMEDSVGAMIEGPKAFFRAREAFSEAAGYPELIIDTLDHNDAKVLVRGHFNTSVPELRSASFWRVAFSGKKISKIEVTTKNRVTLPQFANARTENAA